MPKETKDSVIVSEIFPVRPHGENPLPGNGRNPLRLEVYAMIGLLERVVGKRPKDVRFALLAGHDKILCMFYGDDIDHWQYITEVEKKWPTAWDWRAKLVLNPTDVTFVKPTNGETKLLTEGVIKHAKRGNLRHKSSSRTTGNRPANGKTPEAGWNADPDNEGGTVLSF